MKRFTRTAVAVAGAALVVAPATSANADDGSRSGHGGDDTITTVATGLSGPRQLNEYRGDQLVVAESDSGEVSSVDPHTGAVHTLLSGLFSPSGVDYENGLLYVTVGEAAAPPGEMAPAVPPGAASSALLIAKPDGTILHTVDLLAYELANNPDGQPQFDQNGAPYDALSNPFSVLAQDDRILVADAGANDVLSVDPDNGKISTFFVPPVVDVPGCENANPGITGCDPVPTGVTEGPDGNIYVSTLGALTPGAGRVYVLSPSGKVLRMIDGLDPMTGIAVDSHGTIYVSNLLEGAPEGQPGPDFDPTTVGQVTRIECDGTMSTSQVTMPSGLVISDGQLYASAWSVASMIGMADAGQVVSIGAGTFVPVAG